MYKIGDCVVYGIHGVCRVSSLEKRKVQQKMVTYYALVPLEQEQTVFLVPVDNPVAVSKLRPLMTRQELDSILRSDKVQNSLWIADENQRKQIYRQLISGTDRGALMAMVGALCRHKKEQLAAGRKFHQCDENFLNDAKRILDREIAMVLDMTPAQVEAYILSFLDN
ncbi:MAG: hypothetical protein E7454_01995 [Ruminococcaceae bacterium]|nr:hypothetical protein [Oscillospiraceae bacterium]